MRQLFVVLGLLLGGPMPAMPQVSVGIGISLPGVSIGINLPRLPRLVRVPDFPVYYAPGVASNYFFYDGLYWVLEGDHWYASSWYNGPWGQVVPEAVPVFLLRVPVRYYRRPPPYFRDWRPDLPPRWGEHWGRDWEQRRPGWDRNRTPRPVPAPLPIYQRKYPMERYPQAEQQPSTHGQNYRYQPRDPVVRRYYDERIRSAPVPPARDRGNDRSKDREQGNR